MSYDDERSALDPTASAEVVYPWERHPEQPAERLTVLFAGEPLKVTKSQLELIRRLTEAYS